MCPATSEVDVTSSGPIPTAGSRRQRSDQRSYALPDVRMVHPPGFKPGISWTRTRRIAVIRRVSDEIGPGPLKAVHHARPRALTGSPAQGLGYDCDTVSLERGSDGPSGYRPLSSWLKARCLPRIRAYGPENGTTNENRTRISRATVWCPNLWTMVVMLGRKPED